MRSRDWWRDAAVYQVYVRSFCDSNGDGVGDLAGITSKLGYIADLGVDAIWLTPFYPSPMADHGYDVADYCDVDPVFGTLDDFDKLLAGAHEVGLRLLVDLVPNHTSSAHRWFREALAGGPKRDWYIFKPPAPDGGPPNNWTSVFGGPAWTLDERSGEYYLHLFDPGQPDLNWRNPAVAEEWEKILRFWLDRGVDGFRIDVAKGLFKHPEFADNPPVDGSLSDHTLHSARSPHCWDQPEVLDVYRSWRRICDEYGERMMVGEVFLWDPARVARYIGADLLHQVFNFTLQASPFETGRWKAALEPAVDRFVVEGAGPTWVLSNHDLVRHATRYGGGPLGRRRARAATAFVMGLPGAPYLYQGEELGLEQTPLQPDDRQDPIWFRTAGAMEGRDGCRTPMPWVQEPPGFGFTAGVSSWLPATHLAAERCVQAQELAPTSTLAFYRRLLRLRAELRNQLEDGVQFVDAPPSCLAYIRDRSGGGSVLFACNFGSGPVEMELPWPDAELLLASSGGTAIGAGTLRLPAGSTAWTSSLTTPS